MSDHPQDDRGSELQQLRAGVAELETAAASRGAAGGLNAPAFGPGSLFQAIADGVVLFDKAGHITQANAMAERILGLPVAELTRQARRGSAREPAQQPAGTVPAELDAKPPVVVRHG